MKTLIFCLFLIIVLTFENLTAQVTKEWVATYNGPGNALDYLNSMTVDDSGNVYVTGASLTNSFSLSDYATIKYNSNGIEQWATRYNGPMDNDDQATSIAIDDSGNVYVTGRSVGNGSNYDYATIKYNSNGIQQWVKRYNGPGNNDDRANSITLDNSGNIYVTGSSYGGFGGSNDYTTIKYNSDGAQIWIARYNGPVNNTDVAYSVILDNSNNVYVTGQSFGNATSDGGDYATVKYDSSGIQQWVSRYDGGYLDFPSSIGIDDIGNVYVTGTSFIGGVTDYATIKYNSMGIQQWVQRYNGTGNNDDVANSIAIDNLGNVLVTGRSLGIEGSFDYVTVKYNSSGNQQWVGRYNGNGQNNSFDEANSIVVDDSGNIYVTGVSTGSGTLKDFATLKYNSTGDQEWVTTYNGQSNYNDEASIIVLDKLGNIYVAGYTCDFGTNFDYGIIKYSKSMGITQTSTIIPEKFNLFQNFPNPFNPRTKIKFEVPILDNIKIKIYDILGNEILNLVNQELYPGTYEINWDASNFPSGIYYYKFESKSFNESKKMLLLK